MTTIDPAVTGERADLLQTLSNHRHFLRFTARELSDAQAGHRPTASELCIGGLIKHVTGVEHSWSEFITQGPAALGSVTDMTDEDWEQHANEFRMLDGETLADILAHYEKVAQRTDDLVANVASLDIAHPLPEAPWFEAGAQWSVRRVLLHIITETAQHAGHADILRESLDGAKTMG